ncbi:MAG: hypothetical protein A2408_00880 [Candidatus Yonathbacteria bacterium RIFOXYC1_FULL_52_10]|uniref:Uncharacterized protein n=1 Tax=Candidatus Yonathbacteria bacterium RIFOXYD1_FULL_52_36 TaxID=1802730 RepID=A0A1G2SKN7_9BACT|nr:MAG: hypothetical protein A2591_03815 [Candidatus Yonathbacteria bacterium RIFOXYD1_FULL_52_36]OHA85699.1 MAG: hypothetical protein A2408_00880 [Candidatus Yonathbacteria bacterium RIFOXYC1_FULL_52_10]
MTAYQKFGNTVYKLCGYRFPLVPFFKANAEMDALAEKVTFMAVDAFAKVLDGNISLNRKLSDSVEYQEINQLLEGEEGQKLRQYLEPYIELRGVRMWGASGKEYFRDYAATQFKLK